ncbi:F390 synthetase-related protein [Paracoccus aminophilus]|uniref:Adenylate-forming enzyme n=1 Tax=Paracoccus aminophilus JCM 7686 TaxID=1367847 RepID=S5XLY2_PARAH|nr:F390 synthetase-related protein [Paracoccus aminophilus]AGT08274.1 adenylate-forming enzyme [Paracoccus aminophilus JCM 7686]
MPALFTFLRNRFFGGFRDRAAIDRHQKAGLARLRRKIMPQSPFYASLADRPMADWPVMNKTLLMEHFTEINTRNLPREKALETALHAERSRNFSPMFGDVAVGLSTGTSGQRGLFLTDARERRLWTAVMLARFLPKPLWKRQRIAFFLRANNALYQELGNRLIEFRYYDLLKDFDSHVARLQAQNPTVLVAPAQALIELARRQAAGEIYLAPQRIISVAEVLSPEDAAKIQSAFGHQPDQVYQATEGVLGFTCKAGHLHLNERYLVVERDVIDPETGAFCPVITDFTHETLPILRYRLDDVLIPEAAPCPCGCASQRIARIEGRADDMLYWPKADGGRRLIFSDMIRQEIALLSVPVRDYRIVQYGQSELVIALDSIASERAAKELHSRLEALATRLDCLLPMLTFREGLPPDLGPKRRRIRALPENALSHDASAAATTDSEILRFPGAVHRALIA